MSLEDIFEDPERKARWIKRLRIAYLLWIIMVIFSLTFLALYYLFGVGG